MITDFAHLWPTIWAVAIALVVEAAIFLSRRGRHSEDSARGCGEQRRRPS